MENNSRGSSPQLKTGESLQKTHQCCIIPQETSKSNTDQPSTAEHRSQVCRTSLELTQLPRRRFPENKCQQPPQPRQQHRIKIKRARLRSKRRGGGHCSGRPLCGMFMFRTFETQPEGSTNSLDEMLMPCCALGNALKAWGVDIKLRKNMFEAPRWPKQRADDGELQETARRAHVCPK